MNPITHGFPSGFREFHKMLLNNYTPIEVDFSQLYIDLIKGQFFEGLPPSGPLENVKKVKILPRIQNSDENLKVPQFL